MYRNGFDRLLESFPKRINFDQNLKVSFEETQNLIIDAVSPLPGEDISILDAVGRVLYEDIVSDILIPPVDDSAMDGYAVMAADTRGASEQNPVTLRVAGECRAGDSVAGKQVFHGTTVRIMTGAPIPAGADAVVRFEDAVELSGYVTLFGETASYTNYRRAGENIQKDDIVLPRGDRLKPADIGILASLNRHCVNVYRQPMVSIISTGDELAEPGESLRPGQIRNANACALCAEVKKYNGLPKYLGIAKDSISDMTEMFIRALQADVVISTGGISMGGYDFVKDIYDDLGIEIQYERVRVKPGSSFTFGKKGDTLIFGLPGNPVPALTSFIEFIRPALLRLMGAKRIWKPVVHARLKEDIRSARVHHLVQGYFTIENNEFFVSTTGNQKPSMLRSMSVANCLIMIPEHVEKVKAGENVMIQLIDHDEI